MATGKVYYWIKLKDSFLTSEKVDFLMSQKDGANYIVLYQMLCLKCMNTGGVMARQIGEILIPFDVEKVVRDCKYFSKDTVIVALELYKQLGMIYVQENGILCIADFDNMVGSETDYALQKRNQREKAKYKKLEQKYGQVSDSTMDNHMDNVHIDIRDKRLEIRDKNIYNNISDSAESESPQKGKKSVKHKYGEYNNVLLTDDELEKLKTEYSDWQERIERLSSYVASTGKKYKSHYATVRNWARKDEEKQGRKEVVPSWMNKNKFNNFQQNQYDFESLENDLLANGTKTAGNDPDLAARAEALKQKFNQ